MQFDVNLSHLMLHEIKDFNALKSPSFDDRVIVLSGILAAILQRAIAFAMNTGMARCFWSQADCHSIPPSHSLTATIDKRCA